MTERPPQKVAAPVKREASSSEQEIHTPRIERKVDASEIEARTDRYNAQDITDAFARELPGLLEEKHSKPNSSSLYGYEHLEAFYLNSSDAIELLKKHVDVRDQHVITVGGSTDFAKIFIEKGARKVDLFDISLPGVFYNELCLVALQELEFEDYKNFLHYWKLNEGRPWNDRLDYLSIFDARIYTALRPFLSVQTRTYFDELIKHPNLFQSNGRYNYAFAQFRAFRQGQKLTFGDLIKSENEYVELQSKARKTDLSFSWASANAMIAHIARANGIEDISVQTTFIKEDLFPEQVTKRFADADMVYLSNIEYIPERQIQLAKMFLRAGVKRVLMAMNGEQLGYESHDEFIDSNNHIFKNHYTPEDKEWLKQHGDKVNSLLNTKAGKPILHGDLVEYEGENVRVIDYTDSVMYGVVVEVSNTEDRRVASGKAN